MAQVACYCQSPADLNSAIDKKMKCYLFCLTCLHPSPLFPPPRSLWCSPHSPSTTVLSLGLYQSSSLILFCTTQMLCLIYYVSPLPSLSPSSLLPFLLLFSPVPLFSSPLLLLSSCLLISSLPLLCQLSSPLPFLFLSSSLSLASSSLVSSPLSLPL